MFLLRDLFKFGSTSRSTYDKEDSTNQRCSDTTSPTVMTSLSQSEKKDKKPNEKNDKQKVIPKKISLRCKSIISDKAKRAQDRVKRDFSRDSAKSATNKKYENTKNKHSEKVLDPKAHSTESTMGIDLKDLDFDDLEQLYKGDLSSPNKTKKPSTEQHKNREVVETETKKQELQICQEHEYSRPPQKKYQSRETDLKSGNKPIKQGSVKQIYVAKRRIRDDTDVSEDPIEDDVKSEKSYYSDFSEKQITKRSQNPNRNNYHKEESQMRKDERFRKNLKDTNYDNNFQRNKYTSHKKHAYTKHDPTMKSHEGYLPFSSESYNVYSKDNRDKEIVTIKHPQEERKPRRYVENDGKQRKVECLYVPVRRKSRRSRFPVYKRSTKLYREGKYRHNYVEFHSTSTSEDFDLEDDEEEITSFDYNNYEDDTYRDQDVELVLMSMEPHKRDRDYNERNTSKQKEVKYIFYKTNKNEKRKNEQKKPLQKQDKVYAQTGKWNNEEKFPTQAPPPRKAKDESYKRRNQNKILPGAGPTKEETKNAAEAMKKGAEDLQKPKTFTERGVGEDSKLIAINDTNKHVKDNHQLTTSHETNKHVKDNHQLATSHETNKHVKDNHQLATSHETNKYVKDNHQLTTSHETNKHVKDNHQLATSHETNKYAKDGHQSPPQTKTEEKTIKPENKNKSSNQPKKQNEKIEQQKAEKTVSAPPVPKEETPQPKNDSFTNEKGRQLTRPGTEETKSNPKRADSVSPQKKDIFITGQNNDSTKRNKERDCISLKEDRRKSSKSSEVYTQRQHKSFTGNETELKKLAKERGKIDNNVFLEGSERKTDKNEKKVVPKKALATTKPNKEEASKRTVIDFLLNLSRSNKNDDSKDHKKKKTNRTPSEDSNVFTDNNELISYMFLDSGCTKFGKPPPQENSLAVLTPTTSKEYLFKNKKERNLHLFNILEEILGKRKCKRLKSKHADNISSISLVLTKKERNQYRDVHKSVLKRYRLSCSTCDALTRSKPAKAVPQSKSFTPTSSKVHSVASNRKKRRKFARSKLEISVIPGIEIIPTENEKPETKIAQPEESRETKTRQNTGTFHVDDYKTTSEHRRHGTWKKRKKRISKAVQNSRTKIQIEREIQVENISKKGRKTLESEEQEKDFRTSSRTTRNSRFRNRRYSNRADRSTQDVRKNDRRHISFAMDNFSKEKHSRRRRTFETPSGSRESISRTEYMRKSRQRFRSNDRSVSTSDFDTKETSTHKELNSQSSRKRKYDQVSSEKSTSSTQASTTPTRRNLEVVKSTVKEIYPATPLYSTNTDMTESKTEVLSPSCDTLQLTITDSEIWSNKMEKPSAEEKRSEDWSCSTEKIRKLENFLQKSIGKDLKNSIKGSDKSFSSTSETYTTFETQRCFAEWENLVKQKVVDKLRQKCIDYRITNRPNQAYKVNEEKFFFRQCPQEDNQAETSTNKDVAPKSLIDITYKKSQTTEMENKTQKVRKRSNLSVPPLETVFEAEEQATEVIDVELLTNPDKMEMRIVEGKKVPSSINLVRKNFFELPDIDAIEQKLSTITNIDDFGEIEKELNKFLKFCSVNLHISFDKTLPLIKKIIEDGEIKSSESLKVYASSIGRAIAEDDEELHEELISTQNLDTNILECFSIYDIAKQVSTEEIPKVLEVDDTNPTPLNTNVKDSEIKQTTGFMSNVNSKKEDSDLQSDVDLKNVKSDCFKKSFSRLPVYVGKCKDNDNCESRTERESKKLEKDTIKREQPFKGNKEEKKTNLFYGISGIIPKDFPKSTNLKKDAESLPQVFEFCQQNQANTVTFQIQNSNQNENQNFVIPQIEEPYKNGHPKLLTFKNQSFQENQKPKVDQATNCDIDIKETGHQVTISAANKDQTTFCDTLFKQSREIACGTPMYAIQDETTTIGAEIHIGKVQTTSSNSNVNVKINQSTAFDDLIMKLGKVMNVKSIEMGSLMVNRSLEYDEKFQKTPTPDQTIHTNNEEEKEDKEQTTSFGIFENNINKSVTRITENIDTSEDRLCSEFYKSFKEYWNKAAKSDQNCGTGQDNITTNTQDNQVKRSRSTPETNKSLLPSYRTRNVIEKKPAERLESILEADKSFTSISEKNIENTNKLKEPLIRSICTDIQSFNGSVDLNESQHDSIEVVSVRSIDSRDKIKISSETVCLKKSGVQHSDGDKERTPSDILSDLDKRIQNRKMQKEAYTSLSQDEALQIVKDQLLNMESKSCCVTTSSIKVFKHSYFMQTPSKTKKINLPKYLTSSRSRGSLARFRSKLCSKLSKETMHISRERLHSLVMRKNSIKSSFCVPKAVSSFQRRKLYWESLRKSDKKIARIQYSRSQNDQSKTNFKKEYQKQQAPRESIGTCAGQPMKFLLEKLTRTDNSEVLFQQHDTSKQMVNKNSFCEDTDTVTLETQFVDSRGASITSVKDSVESTFSLDVKSKHLAVQRSVSEIITGKRLNHSESSKETTRSNSAEDIRKVFSERIPTFFTYSYKDMSDTKVPSSKKCTKKGLSNSSFVTSKKDSEIKRTEAFLELKNMLLGPENAEVISNKEDEEFINNCNISEFEKGEINSSLDASFVEKVKTRARELLKSFVESVPTNLDNSATIISEKWDKKSSNLEREEPKTISVNINTCSSVYSKITGTNVSGLDISKDIEIPTSGADIHDAESFKSNVDRYNSMDTSSEVEVATISYSDFEEKRRFPSTESLNADFYSSESNTIPRTNTSTITHSKSSKDKKSTSTKLSFTHSNVSLMAERLDEKFSNSECYSNKNEEPIKSPNINKESICNELARVDGDPYRFTVEEEYLSLNDNKESLELNRCLPKNNDSEKNKGDYRKIPIKDYNKEMECFFLEPVKTFKNVMDSSSLSANSPTSSENGCFPIRKLQTIKKLQDMQNKVSSNKQIYHKPFVEDFTTSSATSTKLCIWEKSPKRKKRRNHINKQKSSNSKHEISNKPKYGLSQTMFADNSDNISLNCELYESDVKVSDTQNVEELKDNNMLSNASVELGHQFMEGKTTEKKKQRHTEGSVHENFFKECNMEEPKKQHNEQICFYALIPDVHTNFLNNDLLLKMNLAQNEVEIKKSPKTSIYKFLTSVVDEGVYSSGDTETSQAKTSKLKADKEVSMTNESKKRFFSHSNMALQNHQDTKHIHVFGDKDLKDVTSKKGSQKHLNDETESSNSDQTNQYVYLPSDAETSLKLKTDKELEMIPTEDNSQKYCPPYSKIKTSSLESEPLSLSSDDYQDNMLFYSSRYTKPVQQKKELKKKSQGQVCSNNEATMNKWNALKKRKNSLFPSTMSSSGDNAYLDIESLNGDFYTCASSKLSDKSFSNVKKLNDEISSLSYEGKEQFLSDVSVTRDRGDTTSVTKNDDDESITFGKENYECKKSTVDYCHLQDFLIQQHIFYNEFQDTQPLNQGICFLAFPSSEAETKVTEIVYPGDESLNGDVYVCTDRKMSEADDYETNCKVITEDSEAIIQRLATEVSDINSNYSKEYKQEYIIDFFPNVQRELLNVDDYSFNNLKSSSNASKDENKDGKETLKKDYILLSRPSNFQDIVSSNENTYICNNDVILEENEYSSEDVLKTEEFQEQSNFFTDTTLTCSKTFAYLENYCVSGEVRNTQEMERKLCKAEIFLNLPIVFCNSIPCNMVESVSSDKVPEEDVDTNYTKQYKYFHPSPTRNDVGCSTFEEDIYRNKRRNGQKFRSRKLSVPTVTRCFFTKDKLNRDVHSCEANVQLNSEDLEPQIRILNRTFFYENGSSECETDDSTITEDKPIKRSFENYKTIPEEPSISKLQESYHGYQTPFEKDSDRFILQVKGGIERQLLKSAHNFERKKEKGKKFPFLDEVRNRYTKFSETKTKEVVSEAEDMFPTSHPERRQVGDYKKQTSTSPLGKGRASSSCASKATCTEEIDSGFESVRSKFLPLQNLLTQVGSASDILCFKRLTQVPLKSCSKDSETSRYPSTTVSSSSGPRKLLSYEKRRSNRKKEGLFKLAKYIRSGKSSVIDLNQSCHWKAFWNNMESGEKIVFSSNTVNNIEATTVKAENNLKCNKGTLTEDDAISSQFNCDSFKHLYDVHCKKKLARNVADTYLLKNNIFPRLCNLDQSLPFGQRDFLSYNVYIYNGIQRCDKAVQTDKVTDFIPRVEVLAEDALCQSVLERKKSKLKQNQQKYKPPSEDEPPTEEEAKVNKLYSKMLQDSPSQEDEKGGLECEPYVVDDDEIISYPSNGIPLQEETIKGCKCKTEDETAKGCNKSEDETLRSGKTCRRPQRAKRSRHSVYDTEKDSSRIQLSTQDDVVIKALEDEYIMHKLPQQKPCPPSEDEINRNECPKFKSYASEDSSKPQEETTESASYCDVKPEEERKVKRRKKHMSKELDSAEDGTTDSCSTFPAKTTSQDESQKESPITDETSKVEYDETTGSVSCCKFEPVLQERRVKRYTHKSHTIRKPSAMEGKGSFTIKTTAQDNLESPILPEEATKTEDETSSSMSYCRNQQLHDRKIRGSIYKLRVTEDETERSSIKESSPQEEDLKTFPETHDTNDEEISNVSSKWKKKTSESSSHTSGWTCESEEGNETIDSQVCKNREVNISEPSTNYERIAHDENKGLSLAGDEIDNECNHLVKFLTCKSGSTYEEVIHDDSLNRSFITDEVDNDTIDITSTTELKSFDIEPMSHARNLERPFVTDEIKDDARAPHDLKITVSGPKHSIVEDRAGLASEESHPMDETEDETTSSVSCKTEPPSEKEKTRKSRRPAHIKKGSSSLEDEVFGDKNASTVKSIPQDLEEAPLTDDTSIPQDFEELPLTDETSIPKDLEESPTVDASEEETTSSLSCTDPQHGKFKKSRRKKSPTTDASEEENTSSLSGTEPQHGKLKKSRQKRCLIEKPSIMKHETGDSIFYVNKSKMEDEGLEDSSVSDKINDEAEDETQSSTSGKSKSDTTKESSSTGDKTSATIKSVLQGEKLKEPSVRSKITKAVNEHLSSSSYCKLKVISKEAKDEHARRASCCRMKPISKEAKTEHSSSGSCCKMKSASKEAKDKHAGSSVKPISKEAKDKHPHSASCCRIKSKTKEAKDEPPGSASCCRMKSASKEAEVDHADSAMKPTPKEAKDHRRSASCCRIKSKTKEAKDEPTGSASCCRMKSASKETKDKHAGSARKPTSEEVKDEDAGRVSCCRTKSKSKEKKIKTTQNKVDETNELSVTKVESSSVKCAPSQDTTEDESVCNKICKIKPAPHKKMRSKSGDKRKRSSCLKICKDKKLEPGKMEESPIVKKQQNEDEADTTRCSAICGILKKQNRKHHKTDKHKAKKSNETDLPDKNVEAEYTSEENMDSNEQEESSGDTTKIDLKSGKTVTVKKSLSEQEEGSSEELESLAQSTRKEQDKIAKKTQRKVASSAKITYLQKEKKLSEQSTEETFDDIPSTRQEIRESEVSKLCKRLKLDTQNDDDELSETVSDTFSEEEESSSLLQEDEPSSLPQEGKIPNSSISTSTLGKEPADDVLIGPHPQPVEEECIKTPQVCLISESDKVPSSKVTRFCDIVSEKYLTSGDPNEEVCEQKSRTKSKPTKSKSRRQLSTEQTKHPPSSQQSDANQSWEQSFASKCKEKVLIRSERSSKDSKTSRSNEDEDDDDSNRTITSLSLESEEQNSGPMQKKLYESCCPKPTTSQKRKEDKEDDEENSSSDLVSEDSRQMDSAEKPDIFSSCETGLRTTISHKTRDDISDTSSEHDQQQGEDEEYQKQEKSATSKFKDISACRLCEFSAKIVAQVEGADDRLKRKRSSDDEQSLEDTSSIEKPSEPRKKKDSLQEELHSQGLVKINLAKSSMETDKNKKDKPKDTRVTKIEGADDEGKNKHLPENERSLQDTSNMKKPLETTKKEGHSQEESHPLRSSENDFARNSVEKNKKDKPKDSRVVTTIENDDNDADNNHDKPSPHGSSFQVEESSEQYRKEGLRLPKGNLVQTSVEMEKIKKDKPQDSSVTKTTEEDDSLKLSSEGSSKSSSIDDSYEAKQKQHSDNDIFLEDCLVKSKSIRKVSCESDKQEREDYEDSSHRKKTSKFAHVKDVEKEMYLKKKSADSDDAAVISSKSTIAVSQSPDKELDSETNRTQPHVTLEPVAFEDEPRRAMKPQKSQPADESRRSEKKGDKRTHCLLSETELMKRGKGKSYDVKTSLTDKEIFEKLLENYEKEDKIAQQLSHDDEFFETQIQSVDTVKKTRRDSIMEDTREVVGEDEEENEKAKGKKKFFKKNKIKELFTHKEEDTRRYSIVSENAESFEATGKTTNTDKEVKFRSRHEQPLALDDLRTDGERRNSELRKGERRVVYTEQEIMKSKELGQTFRRGFRPDSTTLTGEPCFNLSEEDEALRLNALQNKATSEIEFSERESPLDYLLSLGFSIDEASNAIKDEDVKHRLYAAITEARIWVNHINANQGTLLYLAAYKSKPNTMRYFLQLVEAIINKRINDAVKLDAFIKLLERVEDGDISMLKILGLDQLEDEENEEIMLRKQLRQLFVTIYKIAEKEAHLKGKKLNNTSVELLRILAARYRAGLHPHLELIARYIGQGLLVNEIQLEAAMIYLSRLDTADVNLPEFERYCSITCDLEDRKGRKEDRRK